MCHQIIWVLGNLFWTTSSCLQKFKANWKLQKIRIYSQDIGMEFGMEKCTKLIMKRGKREIIEGTELPNQESIRTLEEKNNYKYLGILESDTNKLVEMKEKKKKKS